MSWTRTFTEQDVRSFSELSGDRGSHHVHADERGIVRLVPHASGRAAASKA